MNTIEELGISPVPWKVVVENKRDCRIFAVEANNGAGITDFDCCEEQFSTYEGFANAELIAAAPDLYEALRECVGEMCKFCKDTEIGKSLPCESGCEIVRRAKAALEKAGGME